MGWRQWIEDEEHVGKSSQDRPLLSQINKLLTVSVKGALTWKTAFNSTFDNIGFRRCIVSVSCSSDLKYFTFILEEWRCQCRELIPRLKSCGSHYETLISAKKEWITSEQDVVMNLMHFIAKKADILKLELTCSVFLSLTHIKQYIYIVLLVITYILAPFEKENMLQLYSRVCYSFLVKEGSTSPKSALSSYVIRNSFSESYVPS